MNESLYPKISPYQEGFLRVSNIHSIYWAKSGKKGGIPILLVHGGPGGGSQPSSRRYLDPEKFDIIQFDQRGCGKSIPNAELSENSTEFLIDDIEKLRVHLVIGSWHLFGGSWGSTLSLLYAIKYPSKVKSLTLRGIFLCRWSEIQWFYQHGASQIFPEEFKLFKEEIDIEKRANLIESYYKKLTSSNKEDRRSAAIAWTRWEMATSRLRPNIRSIAKAEDLSFSDAFARIECHYFINRIFLEENYILSHIISISNIPTTIVQGRYDIVCPAISAWELNNNLANSKLIIVEDAGHSIKEDGIINALVDATNSIN